MSGRFSVGRRAFLKLASAASIVGMTGSTSATVSASDQSSYPITVHAFDDGPWEYTIEHAGEIQKGAAAEDNDTIEMSISGDVASGTIHGGYYDTFTSTGPVSRLTIIDDQRNRLRIEHDLDGRSGDLYVTALDGEWTYYISARDTISPTSVSEETETDYGSSVSGHVSAANGDSEDGYNYTETIDFIHVNDAIFFDLTFGN